MIDGLVANAIGKQRDITSPFSDHMIHPHIRFFLEMEGYDAKNAREVPYAVAGNVINAIASSRIQTREKGIVLVHGHSTIEGNSYGFYASISGSDILIRPYQSRGGLEIFPFHEDNYLSQDFGTDTVDASKKLDDNPFIRLDARIIAREDDNRMRQHTFLVFHLSRNPAFVYVPRKPTEFLKKFK